MNSREWHEWETEGWDYADVEYVVLEETVAEWVGLFKTGIAALDRCAFCGRATPEYLDIADWCRNLLVCQDCIPDALA